jgi:hypothetical protein
MPLLVEGLICLNFLKLNKNRCEVNKTAWDDFIIHYKLENLLEIDPYSIMKRDGGRRLYMSSLEALCVALLRAASQV